MGFISLEFILFLGAVLALYWTAGTARWQNLVLLCAGCVFYGWLVPWHVAVLLLSTMVDFLLARGMVRRPDRAGLLAWAGISANLGLLAFVKYYFSFNGTLAGWLDRAGMDGELLLAAILLPLGLSFYILKKISYLLEVRRGVLAPGDFLTYAAYVSFFPQVFSGPIDRPGRLLGQLQAPRRWTAAHFQNAWPLLVMGLFKKIVIANTVKVIVDQVFLLEQPSGVLLFVGGLGYTLQILADFSSYTDLSRGTAFLLGLETTENFDRPYLALTPTEFWNRWHITLSTWLRDYIFFPTRRALLRLRWLPGIAAQSIPPLVTMYLSGLWHGIGSQFVAWGLYYGVLIVVYQLSGPRREAARKSAGRVRRFFSWLTMFALIVFGWLIFRAQSLPWLWNALANAPFYRSTRELIAAFTLLVMISFYAGLMTLASMIDRGRSGQGTLRALLYAAATTLVIVFMNSASPDFIYFQF
jgi:D-alanyl-lipoteichoic acid acyltransferase DltB (MBOAT superfamily)